MPNSNSKPACSLPLLQIWPSQDSPRSEPDGQSFIFSVLSDDLVSLSCAIISNALSKLFVLLCRQDKLTQHLLNNQHRRHVVEARYMSTIKLEIQELIQFKPRLLPLHNNQISQSSWQALAHLSILPAAVQRHPTSSNEENCFIRITHELFARLLHPTLLEYLSHVLIML